MAKFKLILKMKLILPSPQKLTLSGNIWQVSIFSVNFLTHGINFLTHGDNFKIFTAKINACCLHQCEFQNNAKFCRKNFEFSLV